MESVDWPIKQAFIGMDVGIRLLQMLLRANDLVVS
jgi:hypothetical protein